jgi:hypothetical protein
MSGAGVEDNLEQRCAVCGAALSTHELETAREAGGPFLCSLHEAEELPAIEEPDGEAGPVDEI